MKPLRRREGTMRWIARAALVSSDVDGAAHGTYAAASVPFTPDVRSDTMVEQDPARWRVLRAKGDDE